MSVLKDSLMKYMNQEDSQSEEIEVKNDYFSSPFSDTKNDHYVDVFGKTTEISEKEEKNKKQSSDFDEFSELEFELENFMPFDDFADELFSIDEDAELKNSLITQGRKYQQSHMQNAELSEIEKTFSKTETALNKLISDIDEDIRGVQQDIHGLRMSRTRSPKSLSDLISAKNSLHSTKLSALKEINSMKKSIIDLNMKAKKDSTSEEQSSTAASLALQQLIGSDMRDSISNESVRDIAKGDIRGYDPSLAEQGIYAGYTPEEIQDELELEKSISANETEGDLYIKYENRGVELYAQIDQDNQFVGIIARDKEGNYIPDYPIPSVDPTQMKIQLDLGKATDNFNRTYFVERVYERV